LTTGLQLAKKLRPAGRPPARRHHLVSPGDIISESAGDFVGICTQADSPNVNAAVTQGTISSSRRQSGRTDQRQRIHRTLSLDESSGGSRKPLGRACAWRSR
jgi:hypothetical protein